jgi:hypothetical protein
MMDGGIDAYFRQNMDQEEIDNYFYDNEDVNVAKIGLEFTIDMQGNVSDIVVRKGLSPRLNKRAIEIIKSTSGKWTPARIGNKIVNQRLNLPIAFRIE